MFSKKTLRRRKVSPIVVDVFRIKDIIGLVAPIVYFDTIIIIIFLTTMGLNSCC